MSKCSWRCTLRLRDSHHSFRLMLTPVLMLKPMITLTVGFSFSPSGWPHSYGHSCSAPQSRLYLTLDSPTHDSPDTPSLTSQGYNCHHPHQPFSRPLLSFPPSCRLCRAHADPRSSPVISQDPRCWRQFTHDKGLGLVHTLRSGSMIQSQGIEARLRLQDASSFKLKRREASTLPCNSWAT